MKNSKGKAELQGFFLVVVVTVLMTVLVTETILYWRNIPKNHPEWVSGKTLLAAPSMGSFQALKTRNLLHRNRLNLQAWHGENEFLLNRVFQPGILRARVFLAEKACLSILYNKTRDGFSGVRLSRNPVHPGIYFRADADGGFLEKKQLTGLTLTGGWHAISLKFSESGFMLWIDNSLVFTVKNETILQKQVVGFRSGGPHKTLVDNVSVVDFSGKPVINETFRNDRKFPVLFTALLAFFAGILFLVYKLTSLAGKPFLSVSRWIFLVVFITLIFLTLQFCFDYFWFSSLYPYRNSRAWNRQDYRMHFVENVRAGFADRFSFLDAKPEDACREETAGCFLTHRQEDMVDAKFLQLQVIWTGPAGEGIAVLRPEALKVFLADHHLSQSYKIIFFGTSQTWGEGARLKKNQMVFTAYRGLKRKFEEKIFLVINAGIKGARSKSMRIFYEKLLNVLTPDMIVVNLSNNDKPAGFRENLVEMYEISKSNRTKMVLVLEPNNPDYNNLRLQRNHKTMLGVASEKRLFCISLHDYMTSAKVMDSGFLWWDMVHLSAYGQKLAGQYIARNLCGLLKPPGT